MLLFTLGVLVGAVFVIVAACLWQDGYKTGIKKAMKEYHP